VRQLARELACSDKDLHATADRLKLPYDVRHGVDKGGAAIVRRVYLRVPVDAALDEIGRQSVRSVA
jgi:hypothetical protein